MNADQKEMLAVELELMENKQDFPRCLYVGTHSITKGNILLTKSERSAIRRYLIRNRQRILRKKGLL